MGVHAAVCSHLVVHPADVYWAGCVLCCKLQGIIRIFRDVQPCRSVSVLHDTAQHTQFGNMCSCKHAKRPLCKLDQYDTCRKVVCCPHWDDSKACLLRRIKLDKSTWEANKE